MGNRRSIFKGTKEERKKYRKKRGDPMGQNDFRVRKGGNKKELDPKTKKYIDKKLEEELDSLYSRYY
jgi:hypothetical protein